MPRKTEVKDQLDTQTGAVALMHHGRTPAFQHLGVVLDDNMTIPDAFEAAHLGNWDVRTEPLTAMTSEGVFAMDRHQIILRTIDGVVEPIAPIGRRYITVQNEELAAFAQTVLDESDLIVDSAGSIDHGRRVWMTLKSPDTITYGGGDKVAQYLFVATGHDGTMSTIVKPLWLRIRCTNQLPSLFYGRAGGVEYRVRHTSTIQGKVAQAREALNLRHVNQDALDAEIERLLSVKVTAQTFEQIVEGLAPLDADMPTGTQTRRQAMRDDLWSLWQADTQKPIAGTGWAAVNTVIEYVDWFGPSADDADKRARAQLFGTRENVKAGFVKKTLAVVGK